MPLKWCEKNRWMNDYRKQNQNYISVSKSYLLVYVNCGQVSMSEVCCTFAESKAMVPLVAVLWVLILFFHIGR